MTCPPSCAWSEDQESAEGQALVLSDIGDFTHTPVAGNFNYQINWGDGSTPDTGTATITSQGSQSDPLVGTFGGQHTYAVSGMYYVAATVTDPSGGSDTQTFAVTVNADPAGPTDPALLAAALQALGLPANANLATADWARLTSLTADSNKVLSLEGLQNAVNLQSLTLVPGDFSDPGHLTSLSQLSGLSHLTILTLQRCGLDNTVLSTLPTNLTALATLDVRYNNITVIPSAFSTASGNWANLSVLSLYGNPLNTNPVSTSNPTPTWCAALSGKLLTVDIVPQDTTSIIANIDPTNPLATYQAIAAAFYNLPMAIYQYLLNTIKFQPYQGSMKGPLAVVQTGMGNDWDTDTLLVQLFSAAGISTSALSYATTVPPSHTTDYFGIVVNIQTAMQLVGVKTPAALYQALWDATLIPWLFDSSGNLVTQAAAKTAPLSVATVRFQHAWVQWTVGGQTYCLDPTWKLRDLQTGVAGLLSLRSFDETTYLAQPQKGTAAEFYAAQVQQYLADPANSTLNGLTVADVPYDGPIRPQGITSLSTQAPTTVGGTNTYGCSSAFPTQYRQRVRVSVEISRGATPSRDRITRAPARQP